MRKRILIVEPAGLLWGSERALLDLLSEIDRTRFAVTVTCPPDSPLLVHLGARDVPVELLPLASLHTRGSGARIRAMLALSRLFARLRPDVVHLNQSGIVRIAAVPAAILGIPVVSHVRLAEDAALLRDRLSPKLAPRIAIAVSEFVARRLHGSVSEVRVVYDPYAPAEPKRKRSEVREAFGVPLDAPLISMAARICEGKRHDLMLQALAMLSNRSVHLLIVGGDTPPNRDGVSESDVVHRMVRELDLESRVTFTGMRDDVLDILAASDLAALPADSETFGRVLLEALSVGVPVVAADDGGPREIIGDSERGFLFTPGDARSLAKAITQVLDNPAEAALRTAAGTQWVHERCSPAAHARAIESIYDLASAKSVNFGNLVA